MRDDGTAGRFGTETHGLARTRTDKRRRNAESRNNGRAEAGRSGLPILFVNMNL